VLEESIDQPARRFNWLAAAAFYAPAPAMRWNAMFPAWMLLWILFALLQHWLAKRESMATAVLRGGGAALMSGAAFYAISGIRVNDAHTNPNLIVVSHVYDHAARLRSYELAAHLAP
jgi:hypothetical protein